MHEKRYRLNTPTLAILTTDGDKLPVIVPMGGIVQVHNGSLEDTQLVDVEWEGRTVSMFSIDLRARGERVDDGL